MHRRLRRQRAAARLLLRVTKAQELLAAHHSAQQPPRAPPTSTMTWGSAKGTPSNKGKGRGKSGTDSTFILAPWVQHQPTLQQYPVGQGVDRWKIDEA